MDEVFWFWASEDLYVMTTFWWTLGGRQGKIVFKSIVKLREREGQMVDLGRSLKGHL